MVMLSVVFLRATRFLAELRDDGLARSDATGDDGGSEVADRNPRGLSTANPGESQGDRWQPECDTCGKALLRCEPFDTRQRKHAGAGSIH